MLFTKDQYLKYKAFSRLIWGWVKKPEKACWGLANGLEIERTGEKASWDLANIWYEKREESGQIYN